MSTTKVVDISDLSVSYLQRSGNWTRALDNVSLDVSQGDVVGLLGPSGAGKTTLALAVSGVLPPNARLDSGFVLHRQRNILGGEIAPPGKFGISLIFQEPAAVLNPVRRVGSQIADVIEAQFGYRRRRCRTLALEWLAEMRFESPNAIYDAFPHELSGGQRQRIVVAQAFARDPWLVVADEPTSALDAITQSEILRMMRSLVAQRSVTLILITHDPLVLRDFANRVLVLYAGRLVEDGRPEEVWTRPRHPFTHSLLSAAPWLSMTQDSGRTEC